MSMDELWRSVPDYEDRYEVSNLGRVRSIYVRPGQSYCTHCERGRKPTNPRIKKTWISQSRPYPTVRLSKKGTTKNYSVHRLVALAFLPKVPGKNDVNHKDANKLNPRLDNLEWADERDNARHAFRLGLVRVPIWVGKKGLLQQFVVVDKEQGGSRIEHA